MHMVRSVVYVQSMAIHITELDNNRFWRGEERIVNAFSDWYSVAHCNGPFSLVEMHYLSPVRDQPTGYMVQRPLFYICLSTFASFVSLCILNNLLS